MTPHSMTKVFVQITLNDHISKKERKKNHEHRIFAIKFFFALIQSKMPINHRKQNKPIFVSQMQFKEKFHE